MHTYIHTRIHTYQLMYVPTYTHTYIRTYVRTYVHTLKTSIDVLKKHHSMCQTKSKCLFCWDESGQKKCSTRRMIMIFFHFFFPPHENTLQRKLFFCFFSLVVLTRNLQSPSLGFSNLLKFSMNQMIKNIMSKNICFSWSHCDIEIHHFDQILLSLQRFGFMQHLRLPEQEEL